jgi:hypothetical protein
MIDLSHHRSRLERHIFAQVGDLAPFQTLTVLSDVVQRLQAHAHDNPLHHDAYWQQQGRDHRKPVAESGDARDQCAQILGHGDGHLATVLVDGFHSHQQSLIRRTKGIPQARCALLADSQG